MRLELTQRRIALASLLVAAAGGAVFGGTEPAQDDVPDARPNAVVSALPRSPGANEQSARIALEKLNRTSQQVNDVDLFAAKSWVVAPAVGTMTVVPSPPPKPTAPPLPYSYLGQIVDREGLKIFLVNNGDLIKVRQGDAIEDKYRLDAVSAEQLTITYLPLNQKQFLPVTAQ